MAPKVLLMLRISSTGAAVLAGASTGVIAHFLSGSSLAAPRPAPPFLDAFAPEIAVFRKAAERGRLNLAAFHGPRPHAMRLEGESCRADRRAFRVVAGQHPLRGTQLSQNFRIDVCLHQSPVHDEGVAGTDEIEGVIGH